MNRFMTADPAVGYRFSRSLPDEVELDGGDGPQVEASVKAGAPPLADFMQSAVGSPLVGGPFLN